MNQILSSEIGGLVWITGTDCAMIEHVFVGGVLCKLKARILMQTGLSGM
jgi:hypothetical protein